MFGTFLAPHKITPARATPYPKTNKNISRDTRFAKKGVAKMVRKVGRTGRRHDSQMPRRPRRWTPFGNCPDESP